MRILETMNQMMPSVILDIQNHPYILQYLVYSLLRAFVVQHLSSARTVTAGSKDLNKQIRTKISGTDSSFILLY